MGVGDHDGSNRITVACRVKPQDGAAASGGGRWRGGSAPSCVSVGLDERTVAWAGGQADGAGAKHYTFDYAASESVGQEELFEKVKALYRPVVDSPGVKH